MAPVFPATGDGEEARPSCFVIMPITTGDPGFYEHAGGVDHFRHVLKYLFTPAIEAAGFKVIPPSTEGTEIIQARIISELERAELVLCDMSALNANVFFELGVRTAVDKPVCLVHDGTAERLPFDTLPISCHKYDWHLTHWRMDDEKEQLCAHIKSTVAGAPTDNPMWRQFSLSRRAELTSDATPNEARWEIVSEQLNSMMDRLVGMAVDTSPAYRDLNGYEASRRISKLDEYLRPVAPVERIAAEPQRNERGGANFHVYLASGPNGDEWRAIINSLARSNPTHDERVTIHGDNGFARFVNTEVLANRHQGDATDYGVDDEGEAAQS